MIAKPQPWRGYREIPNQLNLAEEVLRHALQPNFASRPAFVTENGIISYGQLIEDVSRLSAGLIEQCRVEPGTRVLVKLWNSYEYALVFLALVKIGALPILMNSRSGDADTSFIAEHSSAEWMVTFGELATAMDRSRHREKLIVARGGKEGESVAFERLQRSPLKEIPFQPTERDEAALMVYTSGTTGRPKGITHAHRWIIALGDSNKLRLPRHAGDIVLASGEWSFISALGHNVLFPLRNGISAAIVDGKSRPERIASAIHNFRVSVLYTVPTLYRRLLSSPEILEKYDFSSLRACNANGEGLEAATLHAWKRATGKVIFEHYGISEMQMIIGQSPQLPLKPGSVGVPWGCRVRIVDDADQPVAIGNVGELQVEAPNPGLFLGYHGDPDKTSAVLHDGWYRTGDYASEDEDGYIWLAGRKDHCFKSRGYFIAPIEIENCCREVVGISEACVLPFPDPVIGQRICAVLVTTDEQDRKALVRRVSEHLGTKLPPYKIPEKFEWYTELPKTALGKVDRKLIQSELSGLAGA